MRIIRSAQTLALWCRRLHREGVRIGFVPTMGALHAGHQSLIRKARLQSDAVIVSIFVNPTQFAAGEDLKTYPRSFRADASLCRAEGVDVVFAPHTRHMYPDDFQTTVQVERLSKDWEGTHRPTHFAGVTTVITKLFTIAQPDLVFFGQKDYQQTLIVRQLLKDLQFPCRFMMGPTIREHDGLALSSRNAYLSREERKAATVLYQALQAGRRALRGGVRQRNRIRQVMRQKVLRQPLARIDYLDLCDVETLAPLRIVTTSAVLLGAIYIGSVRLIDNIIVKVRKS